MKKKGVYLSIGGGKLDSVFDIERKARLSSYLDFPAETVTPQNYEKYSAHLAKTEYAFSTWGMPELTKEILTKYFPSLKAVFYAAGAVKYFAVPLLENGVKVFSAWAANAVPVAETVFAQIILANKGFFQIRGVKDRNTQINIAESLPGNYGTKTGLIGCGMIASLLAQRLKTVDTKIYAYDPYVSDGKLKELNAERVPLEFIFKECDIISNHLPDNDITAGMLTYGLFSQMKPRAVFINSGRGRQADEDGLIRAMREESGRLALLDVTHPEPPAEGSPLYTVPNIILTPHICGSKGNELLRMSDYMINEFLAFDSGRETKYEITPEKLVLMA